MIPGVKNIIRCVYCKTIIKNLSRMRIVNKALNKYAHDRCYDIVETRKEKQVTL